MRANSQTRSHKHDDGTVTNLLLYGKRTEGFKGAGLSVATAITIFTPLTSCSYHADQHLVRRGGGVEVGWGRGEGYAYELSW